MNEKTPAQMERCDDPVTGPLVLQPPSIGSVFRIVQFDPENPDELAKLDGKSAFAEMGAGDLIVQNARHPFMHRTDSLDYSVVLSGEIFMMMDEEEYLLKTGDTITDHAWSNRGTQPCLIAFILIDAEK